MTSGVKGRPITQIVIGPDDTLLDVFDRVREAGDRPIELTIPNQSPLFLTAAEFRTLRDVADHGRHEVTIKTPDPLRLQLARLLGLEVERIAPPVPVAGAPAATPAAKPAPVTAPPPPSVTGPTGEKSAPSTSVADAAAPQRAKPAPKPELAPKAEPAPKVEADAVAPAGADALKPVATVAVVKAEPGGPETPDATVAPASKPENATSEQDAMARWPSEPVEHRPVPSMPRRLMDRLSAGLGAGKRPADAEDESADADAAGGDANGDAAPARKSTESEAAESGATPAADADPERIHWVGARRRVSPRAVAGVLVTVLLLGILGAVVLPSATVELELASVPINSELVFDVTRDGQPLDDQAAFALAGEPITLTVAYESTAPTTGTRAIPDGVATGTVRLANPTSTEQTVEAGTILTTESGVEFAVTEAVVVPAADPATQAAGQADATIEAVNPGTGGNVQTGEIGGQLPNGVYYSNRAGATAGGTDREVRTVAQADLDGLIQMADAELLAGVQAELRSDPVTSGLAMVASSVMVEDETVTFDHELDAEADEVTVRAERTVSLLAYDQAEASAQLASELGEQLQALVPPGYSLGPVALGSDDVTALDGSPDGGRLRFDAGARATLALTDEKRSELAGALAGKSEQEAAALLDGLPEVAEYAIEPGFQLFGSNMPPLAGRIEIDDGTGG